MKFIYFLNLHEYHGHCWSFHAGLMTSSLHRTENKITEQSPSVSIRFLNN